MLACWGYISLPCYWCCCASNLKSKLNYAITGPAFEYMVNMYFKIFQQRGILYVYLTLKFLGMCLYKNDVTTYKTPKHNMYIFVIHELFSNNIFNSELKSQHITIWSFSEVLHHKQYHPDKPFLLSAIWHKLK